MLGPDRGRQDPSRCLSVRPKKKLGDINDMWFSRSCEASTERQMWTDITRAKHARKGLRYSSDLTDAEWVVLEPLLPARSALGRPPKWSQRSIMEGVFYVLRGLTTRKW